MRHGIVVFMLVDGKPLEVARVFRGGTVEGTAQEAREIKARIAEGGYGDPADSGNPVKGGHRLIELIELRWNNMFYSTEQFVDVG